MKIKKTSILALVLLMTFLNGCSIVYRKIRVSKSSPNIILISIDALRADHLRCYGYSRNTSPNIDSFAKRSILFKHCYAHEIWTLPSHMSMLTSLYPITHGVCGDHGLNPAIVTLAEVLKNEGYKTMAFTNGAVWTAPYWGFGKGFDHYSNVKEKNAEQQNALIRKYLEKYDEGKLFLFIHYFDVHSDFNKLPYEAPSPFDTMFSAGYGGNYEGGSDGISASEYLGYINKNSIKLQENDLNYIISLYDNGIAYMDKCIGDLFTMLHNMDLFDNSLIIITADHGEEFQEHGYMLHGNTYYYEEIVHVPLIAKFPKANSKGEKIINDLVESIDIMPTIIDLLSIKKPLMQGKSLIGLIDGNEEGKEYVFGFGCVGRLFIRSGRWKMLNDSGLKEDRFKLFDLHNDPMERVNLIGKGFDVEERLRKKLKEKTKGDPEEKRHLRR